MTLAAILPVQAAKEVRALLPVWTLALAGIAAPSFWPGDFPQASIVYVFGALALGAASVGQEYSHRTLGMLLAQPIDRRRLYAIKAAVLVPMTLSLTAAFFWLSDSVAFGTAAATILPVVGLFIAPWLTMICRSTVGGVVFGFCVPIAILFGAFEGLPEAWASRGAVAAGGVLVAGGCAVVLGWRRFQRLEVVENGQAVLLPRWRRTARAVPRHPVWMLVSKELHLQQLSFATIAVAMVFSWIFLRAVPDPDAAFDVLTLVYVVLLSILIGALASAEERQYGMADVQQLLPVSAWRQWLVKLAVVFGMALVSPAAVPLLSSGLGEDLLDVWIPLSLAVVSLTAGSLYVSSLCRNAMTAVVMSLVVLPFASLAVIAIFTRAVTLFTTLQAQRLPASVIPSRRFEEAVIAGFFVALVALLTRLAFVNHRTAEWSGQRVLSQVLLIVIFLGGWSAIIGALPLFL